jgi:hypothetical protein
MEKPMPATRDVTIDLALIPDLVIEDKEVLALPSGGAKSQLQVDIVDRACKRLRDLQPELDAFDEDELYDLVAHAFAERNG